VGAASCRCCLQLVSEWGSGAPVPPGAARAAASSSRAGCASARQCCCASPPLPRLAACDLQALLPGCSTIGRLRISFQTSHSI
jgi:hypothetical protein